MKQLLAIVIIFSSLNGFSQEKGGINDSKSEFSIKHHNCGDLGYSTFYLSNYGLNLVNYSGLFEVNSLDTVFYDITLETGDSLEYRGKWTSPIPTDVPTLDELESIITVLSGGPITMCIYPGYDAYFNPGLIQTGVIRNSCLLEIKAAYIPNPQKYYVRITFVDPITEDLDLTGPAKELRIYQNDENSLFIDADENTLLEIKVYSLSGQMINKARMEGSNSFDISSFYHGYYIIQVKDSKGSEKQLKFIR